MGFVLSAGKVDIVSDRRDASIRMDPTQLWWSPSGLEQEAKGGVRWYGADDGSYWRAGAVRPGSQRLSDLLALPGKVGSWVEATDRGNGRFLAIANLSGRQNRIGMLPAAPESSIVLVVPLAARQGQESRRLGKAHGFQFAEGGGPLNVLPTGATALPIEAPSAADKKAWTADLTMLRGAAPTLTWATMVDLDRDGQKEGALCVTGGKDDQACYVVDTVDGVRRWHGLSTLRWDGGDAVAAPLAFTQGDGTYLMHVPAARPVLLLARWTGSAYMVESVR